MGTRVYKISLLDRALLRKYPTALPDGLLTEEYRAKIQNKREELSRESEEPQSSRENMRAVLTDAGNTGRQTMEIHITEPASEASVDDCMQSGSRKRRRFTGKATKSAKHDWRLEVKRELVDLNETVVICPSQQVPDTINCVEEILEPCASLHDADRVLIRNLGTTDYVLLYHTLVTDGVLPHEFSETLHQSGII